MKRGHRGGKYSWVDRFMDSGSSTFGPLHRLLPPHDPLTGLILSALRNDPRIFAEYLRHYAEDLAESPTYPLYAFTKMGKQLKRMLEDIEGRK